MHFAKRRLGILLLALTMALAACGASASANTARSQAPVTIQNCGQTLHFTTAPKRILATFQNVTELLLKLGLGDRIVGVEYGEPYTPESDLANAYGKLKPLFLGDANALPSKEVVLATRPDFVLSAFGDGDFIPQYSPTQAQFMQQGAQIYSLTDSCLTNATQGKVADFYTDILNIGTIFGVESKAQSLVTDMQQRIATVQLKVQQYPTVATSVYTNSTGSGDISSIGGGLYSEMIRLAGGQNLFADQTKVYPQLSKEAFAARDPAIYTVVRYETENADQQTNFLYMTFPSATATKNKRVIVVDGSLWNQGIRMPEAIEALARGYHPEAFQ